MAELSNARSAAAANTCGETKGKCINCDKQGGVAIMPLVPAPLPDEITRTLKDISVRAFEVLECAGVARTDCMVDKNGKCYVLEMNTVPGMTPTSLVPDAARAEGTDFGDLCEMILETAHL